MAGSLRDQLIQSGLVTVDRARKIEKQARAEKHAQRQGKPGAAAATGEKGPPTALMEEQRLRSACEREREALEERLSVLETEVGRLRQEHDTLHLVVDELRTDLRDLRDRIRGCVDGCDHRPACGLLHAAA